MGFDGDDSVFDGKLIEQFEQLQAENKRLKEENRWIPVSERLPKGQWSPNHQYLSEDVLITNSCAICIGFYNRQDETWYVGEPREKEWIDKITHWKSLPISPHDMKRIDQALHGRKRK